MRSGQAVTILIVIIRNEHIIPDLQDRTPDGILEVEQIEF